MKEDKGKVNWKWLLSKWLLTPSGIGILIQIWRVINMKFDWNILILLIFIIMFIGCVYIIISEKVKKFIRQKEDCTKSKFKEQFCILKSYADTIMLGHVQEKHREN